jgi:hypothetical protein
MDWFPGLSQLKSAVQAIAGDLDGALETQIKFVATCPIISQATSLCQVMVGNAKGAQRTQEAFLDTMGGIVNSVPVVGHVKGAIHYACGDIEGGNQAMKSSSRTVGKIRFSTKHFYLVQ